MTAAARIARRLVRKIVKPVALWLADQKIRRAQDRFEYFDRILCGLTPYDLKRKVIVLTARKREIEGW